MTFLNSAVKTVLFASIATGALAFSFAAKAEDNRSLCDELASSSYDNTRPAGLAGVPLGQIDVVKALPACRDAQAKAPGDLRLAFQLGRVLMQDGKEAEAAVLFEQAAKTGYTAAMVNLGVVLEDKKPDEAFAWYEKAARMGHVIGEYNLGIAYRNAIGTPVDVTKALEWFQKSSDQGDAAAAYEIAVIHDEGTLVPENTVEALKYYRLAVDRGNLDAMVNLGYMYENGEGVTADTQAALALYKRAVALGDADAKTDVTRLEAATK